MRILETVRRILRNTFHHLSRNIGYSVAAILVTSLAFYSISYFVAAAYNYREALREVRNKPELTVFFTDETTEEQILNLQKSLLAREEVKSVNYISKAEALSLYQSQNRDKPELLEFVTADILPASLEISTTEIEYQETLARELSNNSQVENVIFHGDVVQKLLKLTYTAELEGIIWAISLSTVSIITILVVVGVSISTFGKEIEIMKLVGAGPGFIRWPFILQGVFYGLVAATIAAGLIYVMPYIREAIIGQPDTVLLSSISVFPVPNWLQLQLWGLTALGGALLGAFASTIATWRYLKV